MVDANMGKECGKACDMLESVVVSRSAKTALVSKNRDYVEVTFNSPEVRFAEPITLNFPDPDLNEAAAAADAAA